MDLGLRGKVAVVTGASRGIGRSITLCLAEEGAAVAICARSEPTLRARSVPVYAAACHVGSPEALDGFLDAARVNLGRVDILVNNPSGFVFADDQGGLALAVALAPQRIRVNTVAPGSIEFAGGLWEQVKPIGRLTCIAPECRSSLGNI